MVAVSTAIDPSNSCHELVNEPVRGSVFGYFLEKMRKTEAKDVEEELTNGRN